MAIDLTAPPSPMSDETELDLEWELDLKETN